MQIMAQKVDEQLRGDRCSASRAGAARCQPRRHGQKMSTITPLHGLLPVALWAWEYCNFHFSYPRIRNTNGKGGSSDKHTGNEHHGFIVEYKLLNKNC